MFDANTHLHFDALWPSRQAILAEACGAGLTGLLVSATELSPKTLARLDYFAGQGAAIAVGWHPQVSAPADALDQLSAVLEQHADWWVGEIGIDTRYPSDLGLLEGQFAVAQSLGRACVVHAVGKGALHQLDLVASKYPWVVGVIHAFSGSPEQAMDWAMRGWKLSIGGPLLHPNRPRLAAWVESVPLDALVVESDSPDLPPAGWDGPNRPVSVRAVIDRVAEIRGQSAATVAAATEANMRLGLGVAATIVPRGF